MNKFTACDFDGTIFTNAWPGIGDPIPEMIAYLRNKQSLGEKIGLWTCREGKMLVDALEACEKVGLVFDAVNENLQERKDYFQTDPRKMGADEYIDDHATNVEDIINPRPTWTNVTDGLPAETKPDGSTNWVLAKTGVLGNCPPMVMQYYQNKWYYFWRPYTQTIVQWCAILDPEEVKTNA